MPSKYNSDMRCSVPRSLCPVQVFDSLRLMRAGGFFLIICIDYKAIFGKIWLE